MLCFSDYCKVMTFQKNVFSVLYIGICFRRMFSLYRRLVRLSFVAQWVQNCYFGLDLTVIMSQSGITAPMVLKCCPKVLDASDMVMPCPNTVILPTRVWYSHETILTTLSTQTLWGQELLGHKEARKKRQIKMMAVFFLIFLIPDIYIVYAACCLLSTLVQYSLLSSLLQNVLILLT